jgi:SagB-type dehydrogenase family enzyme
LRSGDYREILVRASAAEPTIIAAPAVIVCADTFWRNTWKYQARTYRHSFWDSGTLLANLLATAQVHQIPANVVLGFVDEEVNRLLDLDGEREAVLSLVPLGFTPGESIPPAPAVGSLSLETVPLSREEVAYPAIQRMHQSSSLASAEEVAAWRGKTPGISLPEPSGFLFPLERNAGSEPSSDSLEQVVLRRGSTRQFAREPISFKQFSRILRSATQGIPADFLEPPGSFLNQLYVIALAVDGIPKGSYVYHRDRESLELLKEGDYRREGGFLGLEQALPADASVDIFFLTDLKPLLERYGNRGYRAAELEAGIIGGKLYLAAYAERLGATGLTFYDDEVTDFFSPHAEGKSVMFLMSLGRSVRHQKS